jgi:hypothetical protein
MRTKLMFLLLFLAAGSFVLKVAAPANRKDVHVCSTRALRIMSLVDIGEKFTPAMAAIAASKNRYSVWKDGVEVVSNGTGHVTGPAEIFVTVDDNEKFGFLVAKRNLIVLAIDGLNVVSTRRCVVTLTGP